MVDQIDLRPLTSTTKNNWDNVEHQFHQWAHTFNIQEEISEAAVTSIPWTKFCSPETASQESMLLAFMYVALFFYLDDYQDENFEEVCDRYLQILDGAIPHKNDNQISYAFYDFIQRLSAQGVSIDGFTEWGQKVINVYKQRYAIRQNKSRVDLQTYQDIRAVTINVYPWWELWQILEGYSLTPAEKNTPEMKNFLNLAAAVMYMANDLYSLERDKQSGELNYVSILSSEGKIPSADAFHLTRMLLHQRRQEFDLAYEKIVEINNRQDVHRFVYFVRKVVDTGFDILQQGSNGRYTEKQENIKTFKGGLSFLKNIYRRENSYQSFISVTPDMLTPVESPEALYPGLTEFPSEIFTTMIIADLIFKDKPGSEITSELVSQLQSYQNDGIFNFFCDNCLLPADIDCTAIGMSILIETGKADMAIAHQVAGTMLNTVDENGIIQVYFPPCGHRHYVDPVVCVNALYFITLLGRENEAGKTEEYVFEYLRSKRYLEGTRYYPSPDIFLYFLSRLVNKFPYFRGRFGDELRRGLQLRMGTTQSPLDLAARLVAAKFAGISNEIDESALVLFQNGNGGWSAGPFFKFGKRHGYFGCDALTTAFAVKALESDLPKLTAYNFGIDTKANGTNGRNATNGHKRTNGSGFIN